MNERVRAVQERRRSSAAGPHRQARDPGPSAQEWASGFLCAPMADWPDSERLICCEHQEEWWPCAAYRAAHPDYLGD